MKNIGLLLSGGTGTRFNSELPKQYTLLNDKEVISYSINAFKKSVLLDDFIVVAGFPEINSGVLSEKYQVKAIHGGDARNKSLMNGLKYIEEHYPSCENIFIHEAARPFLTSEIIDRYLHQLNCGYDAVITTQKITASLGSDDEWVVDRSRYYLIEAPEAFNFRLLLKYFNADSPITATVQQLPDSIKLMKYFDFPNNLKLTYQTDVPVMEALMKYNDDIMGYNK